MIHRTAEPDDLEAFKRTLKTQYPRAWCERRDRFPAVGVFNATVLRGVEERPERASSPGLSARA